MSKSLSPLMEGEPTRAEGIRPVERVVARGTGPRWRVPDADAATVRLEPVDATGEPGMVEGDSVEGDRVVEGRLAVDDGIVALPPVPPGHYRYEVRVAGESGTGEITVSEYSPELTRPVMLEPVVGGTTDAVASGSRPLRSTPWGYVAVLALLSAEWVLRRRWGLR